MNKLIIASFLMVFFSVPALARMPLPRMDVVEAAVDTSTSSAIDIGLTATNVISGSVELSSATILEVFNADGTYSINCGYESNVSTISTSVAYGREILPKTGYYYAINMDKISVWCKTQHTSATRAVISKGR